MSSISFLRTFTKFFPLPKALSFDFVGVDICKKFIRVMKLEESKFGKIPTKYKEYELKKENGLMRPEPELKDHEELLSVLRKIKKEFGVNYVNVSIPEVRNYIYKVNIPSKVEKNISEAILSTVEENVPIKSDEVLLDYYVVGVEDEEIEVVVTAVPKNFVELYTQLFEQAGLKPISFEPETHAITRGIIKKGDTSDYLLFNLDSCLSSVAVIEDEIVQYTQTVPVTSNDFKEKFDEQSAKILKESINKIIIYWETLAEKKLDTNKIQTLFLVGDFDGSMDLLHYLSKNLSMNVKFANTWSNCFNLDEYIPQINAVDSLKYSIATGLALKRIK
jgi:Tfp pilus assembly PilM family ATPase